MSNSIQLTEDLKNVIRTCRHKILDNCMSLLRESVELFAKQCFPRACFLAMTAMEEAGKLTVLRFFAHRQFEVCDLPEPIEMDQRRIMAFLRDHVDKARLAAAQSLYINAGADRRHGTHPISGLHRTSGVILLVRSGRWMNLRNACLYVDLSVAEPATTSPFDVISIAHAYYMICMAYEIVAEQADAAIEEQISGNLAPWLEFEEARIGELKGFMSRYGASVALDQLDFLANPEPLRQQAERHGR